MFCWCVLIVLLIGGILIAVRLEISLYSIVPLIVFYVILVIATLRNNYRLVKKLTNFTLYTSVCSIYPMSAFVFWTCCLSLKSSIDGFEDEYERQLILFSCLFSALLVIICLVACTTFVIAQQLKSSLKTKKRREMTGRYGLLLK